jgi:hypothetical protein
LLKIYFNVEIKSHATKAPVLTLSRVAAIWDLRASKQDGKNIEIIMLFSFPCTLKTKIYIYTLTVTVNVSPIMFVFDFDLRNSFRLKWTRLTTEATFHQTKHGPTQQTILNSHYFHPTFLRTIPTL